jgi:DNA-binding PadR family transcriptional regulator
MVTARTAVLLALRRGPGYGRELVRRIRTASGGRLRLAEGSVYPALRHLERSRLARCWEVVPGRRRGGRSRTYYELTERGVRASAITAVALGALLAPVAGLVPPSAEEVARMQQRLALGAELSETALVLSLRPSGRSRRSAT